MNFSFGIDMHKLMSYPAVVQIVSNDEHH